MLQTHKNTLKSFEATGGRFIGFWLAADESTLTVAIAEANTLPGEAPTIITRQVFNDKGEQIAGSEYPHILKPNKDNEKNIKFYFGRDVAGGLGLWITGLY